MSGQFEIIKHVSEGIATLIESIEKPEGGSRYRALFEPVEKWEPGDILLRLIDIEPAAYHNSMERVQIKEEIEKGVFREYHVEKASLFNCIYMIKPCTGSPREDFVALGELVRLFKDNNRVEPGEFSWVGNRETPVIITQRQGLDMHTRIALAAGCGSYSSPALFYEVTVGIDSGKKEQFTRVDERKFDMFKKN
jgi:hypothetical protein